MFGKKALTELQDHLSKARSDLEATLKDKKKLEEELASARRQISELQESLNGSDVKQLEKKAKATIAEYEGLKELYTEKIREFNETREGKEQSFAREAALKRHDLENEIHDHREANQKYVAETVETFSDTYNYYLNQIKVLMDALGKVAIQTGSTLFQDEDSVKHLRSGFGQRLADELRSGTDRMESANGDLIVIGAVEEEPEACPAEAEAAPEDTVPEQACPCCAEKAQEAECAGEACECRAAECTTETGTTPVEAPECGDAVGEPETGCPVETVVETEADGPAEGDAEPKAERAAE